MSPSSQQNSNGKGRCSATTLKINLIDRSIYLSARCCAQQTTIFTHCRSPLLACSHHTRNCQTKPSAKNMTETCRERAAASPCDAMLAKRSCVLCPSTLPLSVYPKNH